MQDLFHHMDVYILHITTAPRLQVIVGHPEVFHEFDRLMQMKSDDVACLFYDTNFETGDFYISTLQFKHFLFEGEPISPCHSLFIKGDWNSVMRVTLEL